MQIMCNENTHHSCKIAILVNDKAHTGFLAEHGLSFWIKADGKRILFDTGQGDALPQNAKRLGIDLQSTDILVLSHGHYDHTGGIPSVTAQAKYLKIFCHPEAICPKYCQKQNTINPIGIPHQSKESLSKIHPDALHWVQNPVLLTESIGLSGTIPRLATFEGGNGNFFLDPDRKHIDPIEDDLALWISTKDGLVIVVGCAHAGLINTINYIVKTTKIKQIKAIIGGFHLLESEEYCLNQTMVALRELNPTKVIPCHCTGAIAVNRLVQALPGRVESGIAGSRYDF